MTITVSMPGYARLKGTGLRGLVVESCRTAVQQILDTGTLYSYAASQPDARAYKGRAPAYAITLGDGCGRVVVRHAMRGGLIGKSGTDLFLPPTRGLRELVNSMRLRLAGVPTPEVVAIVTYRAGPLFRRSDVATREIPDSHDLSVVLREMPQGSDRHSCLTAAGALLAAMAAAGAHHPDLNARNILITWESTHGARAHVLDVDRIRFNVPQDPMVARANADRLARSLRKLRDTEQLPVDESEIAAIRTAAAEVKIAG
jgi:3-deoxy-D-manno-octulosonic acid kinase